jgi:peptidoglycan/xylan/chitin deacetylase (PgdA/CDA1 family)
MSLLVLMFHRARSGRHGNAPEMLDAHFAHLAHRAKNVLPGESLTAGALNICVTFDDGYYDFHATVFPLLRKHQLRALLAIPPHFIRDEVTTPSAERMRMEIEPAFAEPERGGFCTWPELKEMVQSGHVTVAAHGLTHRRLDAADVDLTREIDEPGRILRERVGGTVDSFVYPFGRCTPAVIERTRRSYRHVFRIGGAINRSWDQRVLYRVDADAMEGPWSLLEPRGLLFYRARYLWNRVRGR